jgi:hypothetical protein
MAQPPIQAILVQRVVYPHDTDIVVAHDDVCLMCREPYDQTGRNGCRPIRFTHCGHLIGEQCFFNEWALRNPKTCPYWNHALPTKTVASCPNTNDGIMTRFFVPNLSWFCNSTLFALFDKYLTGFFNAVDPQDQSPFVVHDECDSGLRWPSPSRVGIQTGNGFLEIRPDCLVGIYLFATLGALPHWILWIGIFSKHASRNINEGRWLYSSLEHFKYACITLFVYFWIVLVIIWALLRLGTWRSRKQQELASPPEKTNQVRDRKPLQRSGILGD